MAGRLFSMSWQATERTFAHPPGVTVFLVCTEAAILVISQDDTVVPLGRGRVRAACESMGWRFS